MILKEACKRIGVNYNTAKTYISELKKSGLTIKIRDWHLILAELSIQFEDRLGWYL